MSRLELEYNSTRILSHIAKISIKEGLKVFTGNLSNNVKFTTTLNAVRRILT